MLRKAVIFVWALVVGGCAIQPRHESLTAGDLPRLIPVRDFVANTDYNGHYRISPDGKRLAWKAVTGVREQIFVRSLGGSDAHSLGFDAQGYHFVWAQDSRHLLFIKDTGGNENFHLYRVDSEKSAQQPVDITPLQNSRVFIQQLLENDPAHVLILHNGRDPSVFDLYRLNILTGDQDLLYENGEDITHLVTDRQGRLMARVRQDGTRRYLELPEGHEVGWRALADWTTDDQVQVLKFSADGRVLHMLSNRGRDKVALVGLNVSTGQEQLIYSHPAVDVSSVQINRNTLEPALAYVQPDYPEVVAVDPALQADLERLLKNKPVGIYVTSSDDAQRLLTLAVNDDREVTHYLYDRHSGELTLLGKDASHAFADDLVDMRPVSLMTRDGLTLHGYLTLPDTAKRPLPTVLLVHGGPFARDIWKYNRQVQFLANRGYAVLQVNYRGSSGYGRAFMEAAIGEFAGKMHQDLIDAADWAVSQGIADPERVAIMGRSFGGYATLVGMTMTPGVFACGIDIVGPAELESLTRNYPPYWAPFMHRWLKYAGDPDKPADAERMRASSPLYFADRVQGPLLIVQGANDVRVKQGQSDRMVEALRVAGKPVDYLLIRGEGHHIRHWKNRLTLYRKTEDFLAGCLGGRSGGFDYYQLGSWMF